MSLTWLLVLVGLLLVLAGLLVLTRLLLTLHHRLSQLIGLLADDGDLAPLVLILHSDHHGSVSICVSVARAHYANDDEHAHDATDD